MSVVYDNWERLVGATLRREQLRRSAQRSFSDLSLAPSSSFNSRASSRRLPSFDLLKWDAFDNEQIPCAPNYLKIFTFDELKSATGNFNRHGLVAEGAFWKAFKGWVDVGFAVAVKLYNLRSQEGLEVCQTEVEFSKKFCHPNIVKLLGYCLEDGKFLFVYEYAEKGSLKNHLFKGSAETLPWEIRMKIAIGAARALAFLHTTEEQVIHRDIKATGILLDGDYNAKLSSFGLVKSGPVSSNSHVSTRVVGTYGYAAEYMATGHLFVKSAVYNFGLVLLELLSGLALPDLVSGLRVFNLNRFTQERNFVTLAMHLLRDERKFKNIVDPRLEGQYPLRAAFQSAKLILECVVPNPNDRPSMEQVLKSLQQIATLKKDSESNHKK